MHDVPLLDRIEIQAGAYSFVDRGYLNFARLDRFTPSSAFFVTPSKKNVLRQRGYSDTADKGTGTRSDQRSF